MITLTEGETSTHGTADTNYATTTAGNSFCMVCHNATNGSHGTHHVTTELASASLICTVCHSVTPTASSLMEGYGYAGVTPVWANLVQADCLACHNVSTLGGTSTNPGVSPALSLGLIEPGTNHHGRHADCTWCHSETNSAGHTGGGMITLTEGETSTHGTADTNYATTTAGNSFCMVCHSNSGAHAVHHVTTELASAGLICTVCHSVTPTASSLMEGDGYAGVTPIFANLVQADCQACHTQDMGTSTNAGISPAIDVAAINPATNHHGWGTGLGSNCIDCHTAETFAPMPLTTDAACEVCHGERVATTNHLQLTTTLANGLVYTALTCANCHAYTDPLSTLTTYPGEAPGIVPCYQCHEIGATYTVWPLTDAQLSARALATCSVSPSTNTTEALCTAAGGVWYSGFHQMGLDLAVSSMLVGPSSVLPGGSVTVTDVTANLSGGGTAGASVTAYYLSAGTTCPTSVSGLGSSIGSRAVGSLGPGASSQGSAPATIPLGTAPGQYMVVAHANDTGTVIETNYNNNIRCYGISVTSNLGDLVVAAASAPATATHGTSISITERTQNIGGATIGASKTNLYYVSGSISCPTTLPGSATLLYSRSVSALLAGASSNGAYSVTAPSPAGTYTLIWEANAGSPQVPEANYLNDFKCQVITTK